MPSTKNDSLLEPFHLKHLTLRNRIMSTSHACGLGDHNAMPAEAYQAYHIEKARGGLALTMFGGSSYVSADSTWASGQLNFSTDQVIPHLLRFSERIHAEGAALMVQLTHLGRRGENYSQHWLPTIAPTAIREPLHRSIPREMDRHDIDRVIKQFGEAAYRCREGGLDGLETMTQGHLIGQFFSPLTNHRTDDFGGSVSNRCRFGLLVHEEIRKRVGDDFVVGMRLGVDEATRNGQDFADSVAIAKIFEESGLIDFFNANFGRIDKMLAMVTDCMPGMSSPIAPWLQVAGDFKQAVGLPVFHAARIADIATARYAIREGLLDMVAMTRAHIADPYLVQKIKQRQEERIRPCVGATHCMGNARPTCVHNAASGREQFWPQRIQRTSNKPQKIVVVGGGPCGLEAARVSAERGHQVTLLEAANKLGGQLLLATRASWRNDLTGIIDWRTAELERLGVDIRLNCYAEKQDILNLHPDIVILATGGLPELDQLSGAEYCMTTWDILSGHIESPQNTTASNSQGTAVVYDGTGRHAALTAAETLSRQGREVQLVLFDEAPALEEPYSERTIWKKRLAEEQIAISTEFRLTSVTRNGNRLAANFSSELTAQGMTLEADQVIAEFGTQPIVELFNELKEDAANKGYLDIDKLVTRQPQPFQNEAGFCLYRIGDAAASRNLATAIYDALRLCSIL